MSILRWILPLVLYFYCFPLHATPFIEDCQTARSTAESATLTIRHNLTAEYLGKWQAFADFPELLDDIQEGFAHRPRAEVAAFLKSTTHTTSEIGPFNLLERALMATAAGEFEIAVQSYRVGLMDEPLAKNPFVHGFLARALLVPGKLAEATPEYELAVQLAVATGDRATAFRAKHLYADDLFDAQRIDLAIPVVLPMLESDYPFERAWALTQKALYDWGHGDKEGALKIAGNLRKVLPFAIPHPDLDWQRRRHEAMVETLQTFDGVLVLNPVLTMTADEESLDYQYMGGNVEAAKTVRIWVERYPLEQYATWTDPKQKEMAVWCHSNYYSSLCHSGQYAEAKAGFCKIIDYVPFEEYPGRVVDAWCWLGLALKEEGDYEGAKAALKMGLDLDAVNVPSTSNLAKDENQPRIRSGKTYSIQRERFVAHYQEACRYAEKQQKKVEEE